MRIIKTSECFIESLSHKFLFQRVSKSDRKAITHAFIIQALAMPAEAYSSISEDRYFRLGFVITKKLGSAVVRNRIRRQLRAIIRELFPVQALSHYDYVIVVRHHALTLTYHELKQQLTYALAKLTKLLIT